MKIKLFNNNEFGNIETLTVNNKIYFNLNTVANILDIKNPREVTKSWSDVYKVRFTNKYLQKISDVSITDIRKLNNAGETFLTEAGLNKMIFKSRKPNAEMFYHL